MTEKEHMEYYWQMLRDEKIITDLDDVDFTFHPSFSTILENYLIMYKKDIMLGLIYTVQSYCPTASRLQLSIICNFVTTMMKESTPQLFKQLDKELKIEQIRHPRENNPLIPKNFDNAITMLKDEKKGV